MVVEVEMFDGARLQVGELGQGLELQVLQLKRVRLL